MLNALAMRPATAADVSALTALINSAYRGESSKAGWTTEAELIGGQRVDTQWLTAMIADLASVILVYEDDGHAVGCVYLRRTEEGCYLGMLTVAPTRQRDGLGRGILEASERWAAEQWGSQSMRMRVISSRDELLAWYERRGYRLTGEREPFPYGDERFGLPKRDDLEFVVLVKPLTPRSILS